MSTAIRSKIERFRKIRRRLRDRERRFQRMSPKQQRITIARDVIEALSNDLIRPKRGTYLASRTIKQFGLSLEASEDTNEELRKNLEGYQHSLRYDYSSVSERTARKRIEILKERIVENRELIKDLRSLQLQSAFVEDSCTACALGSMFRCLVLRKDALTLQQWTKTAKEYRSFESRFDGGHRPIARYLSSCFSRSQINLIEEAFEIGDVQIFVKTNEKGRAAVYFGTRYASARARLTAIMENIVENDGEFIPPPAPHDWVAPPRFNSCY